MSDPLMDGSAVQAKWVEAAPLIDRMMERVGTAGEFPVGPRSSLAGDDGASSPYQLSHALRLCLTAGVDHLHAVKVLVVDNELLHVGAPSSLARGALENFAAAYWMLGPESRTDRVERVLRWHARNMKDGSKAASQISMPEPTPLPERLEKLFVVGRRRSIDDKAIRGTFTSTEAVTYAQEAAPDLPLGVVFPWQLCSGFAHGRPWAYLGATSREEQPDGGSDVVNVRMTSTLGLALFPNLAALHLLERFLRLYQARANCHLV